MLTKLRQLLSTHPFDQSAWDAAVAPDVHVQNGNAAPAIGKSAALAELSLFVARIQSVGANFCETCKQKETIFAEVEIAFADGTRCEQRIPCVIVARTISGCLVDLRIHLDPSPIP